MDAPGIARDPDNTNDLENHKPGEAAMKKQFAVRSLVAATALAVVALSPVAHADAGVTGSLGVVSKYVLRGITTPASEHDGAAVQAGITYDTGTGFSLGWWGSSLSYADNMASGFENDIIADYSLGLGEDMTLAFGGVYYYYVDIDDADVLEPYVNFSYGPLTVGAKVLTDDVVWGNKTDTYLTVSFSQDLPMDFSFTALAGFYRYKKDGEFLPETAASKSSGFRHLDLTLSHPLGKTGLDMSVTYIVGGEDRYGGDQEDTMVLGVSGSF